MIVILVKVVLVDIHCILTGMLLTLVVGMQLCMSAEEAEKRQKNAARVRKWRENLNPQQLEEERRKDHERQKRRRQRPLTAEAKEHQLQLAKERNRRYRYVLSTSIMVHTCTYMQQRRYSCM